MSVELVAQQEAAAVGQTAEVFLFWVASVVAIGAAVATVTMRNVVHGALMLVLNLVAIAGLFLALQSPFLAVVQVIVYGGAIMVLFLFVIMLLGVRRDDLYVVRDRFARVGAWLLGLALIAAVAAVFVGPYTGPASVCGSGATGPGTICAGLEQVFEDRDGSVAFVARALFSRYVFAFEFVALLLVVATIAALVVGRRTDLPPESAAAASAHPGPAGELGTAVGAGAHDHGARERQPSDSSSGGIREDADASGPRPGPGDGGPRPGPATDPGDQELS